MGDDWASPDAIGVSHSKRAGSPTSAAPSDAPIYPCSCDRCGRRRHRLCGASTGPGRGGSTQKRTSSREGYASGTDRHDTFGANQISSASCLVPEATRRGLYAAAFALGGRRHLGSNTSASASLADVLVGSQSSIAVHRDDAEALNAGLGPCSAGHDTHRQFSREQTQRPFDPAVPARGGMTQVLDIGAQLCQSMASVTARARRRTGRRGRSVALGTALPAGE
jgi:hypothetical protein